MNASLLPSPKSPDGGRGSSARHFVAWPMWHVLRLWRSAGATPRSAVTTRAAASACGPSPEQSGADHRQHGLAALVDRGVADANHTAIGLARRRPHLEDLAAGGDGVARAHRP